MMYVLVGTYKYYNYTHTNFAVKSDLYYTPHKHTNKKKFSRGILAVLAALTAV